MRSPLLVSLSPFLSVFSLLAACGGTAGGTSSVKADASFDASPPEEADASPAAPSAEVLTRDANVSGEIAASDSEVFWVDRGAEIVDSIRALPVSRGKARTLYDANPGSAAIEDLVSDASNVYWVEVTLSKSGIDSDLKTMPQQGGTPTTLAHDSDTLLIVAVDGGFVYFGDITASLSRVPTTGGTATKVASWTDTSTETTSVTADAEGACWTETVGASLSVVCRGTGASANTVIASHEAAISALTMIGTTVAWATEDFDNPTHATVKVAPIAGGPQRVLTSAATYVVALTADTSSLYYIEQTASAGSVVKLPLAGGEPTTIAGGLSIASPSPTSIVELAVDATSVFFTDTQRGLVLSASK
jgi:hypothetical protein